MADPRDYTKESRMTANNNQVGGDHYKSKQKIQHWDWVAANNMDYFQGQITKYVSRWKDKNGLEDLKKAQHFLEKYIELIELDICPEDAEEAGRGYVNQDPPMVITPPTSDVYLMSASEHGLIRATITKCVQDEETKEYSLEYQIGDGMSYVCISKTPVHVGSSVTLADLKALSEKM